MPTAKGISDDKDAKAEVKKTLAEEKRMMKYVRGCMSDARYTLLSQPKPVLPLQLTQPMNLYQKIMNPYFAQRTPQILFDSKSYLADSFGTLFVVDKTANSSIKERDFVCVFIKSNADNNGIIHVLRETTPTSGLFKSVAYVFFTEKLKSKSEVYIPNLRVGTDDTVTAIYLWNNKMISTTTSIAPNPTGLLQAPSQAFGSSGAAFDPSVAGVTARPVCIGDTDKDGICDEWENGGRLHVTFSGATYWGFTSGCSTTSANTLITSYTNVDRCPSRTVKDVYVTAQYLTGRAPDLNALRDVINSYKGKLPDGTTTLRPSTTYAPVYLHIQVDDGASGLGSTFGGFPIDPELQFPAGYDAIKVSRYVTVAEAAAVAPANVFQQKSAAVHYSLFANQIQGDTGTSGLGEWKGNDFVVSLGNPIFSGSGPGCLIGAAGSCVGTTDIQEGTFMHELGHNLGLDHGGFDSTNCKPNHLSVMNYLFQFKELYPGTHYLDYSQQALGTTAGVTYLNENTLNEFTGLGSTNPNNWGTVFGPEPVTPTGTGISVNWDKADSLVDSTSADINQVPAAGCPVLSGQTLQGYKEWSDTTNNLIYNFRPYSTFCPAGVCLGFGTEITADYVLKIRESRMDAIIDSVNKLPNSAFGTNDPSTSKQKLTDELLQVRKLISSNLLADAKTRLDTTTRGLVNHLIMDPYARSKIIAQIDDEIASLGIATTFGPPVPPPMISPVPPSTISPVPRVAPYPFP